MRLKSRSLRHEGQQSLVIPSLETYSLKMGSSLTSHFLTYYRTKCISNPQWNDSRKTHKKRERDDGSLTAGFDLLGADCVSGRHGASYPALVSPVLTRASQVVLETWETWVWSLGQEDPLEEGMAAHSSILAWRIPWTEEPGGLQSTGQQTAGHNWTNSAHSALKDL